MLRVPLEKIESGMVLARPIPQPNSPHRYLLQRDREIPMSVVPRLRELGILFVWVRYPQLEFLEEVIDEGVSERQHEVYWQVRRNFESFMNGTSAQLDLTVFQKSIGGLFDCLKQSLRGNLLLQKLDAYDNVLMSHSANVCYLSMLLGMKLEQYLIEQRSHKSARDAKDLQELGLGCLLHDVGKMLVPSAILNKRGRLTELEMEEIKRHPIYGYEMVRGRVSAVAAQVVLNHHQRFEGGGYPARFDVQSGEELPPIVGNKIPVAVRIATVCDVYDAATTARVYGAAKPAVQVLHEMHTCCRTYFDPVILRAFTEIVPAFPMGQIVTLSDGAEAVVVDFNPRFAMRPKVQIVRTPDGENVQDPSLADVDLAINPDLEIVEVDNLDIRPFTRTLAERTGLATVCA